MYGLSGGNVFGRPWRKRCVKLRELPVGYVVRCDGRKFLHRVQRRRRVTSGEHGLCINVCCRDDGTRRLMYDVRGREVQDEQRECRVHGLWASNLFGDCGRKRFVDVFVLSFECKCACVEYGRCCLYL